MRKFSSISVVLLMLSAWAASQSLGDLAREQRAAKKPRASMVYTNDELPSIPAQREEDSKEKTESSTQKEPETKDSKKDEADAKKKASDAQKAALTEQTKAVTDLEREINLREREWDSRPHDVGGKWITDAKKHQEEMDALKSQRDAAKAKLAEMTEAARKAGVTP